MSAHNNDAYSVLGSTSAVDIFNLQPHKDLYDVLMHATDSERESLCNEEKYKAICALLVYDKFLYNNAGDMALNKLGRSTFKVVLESFPEDFSQGQALIEATHPAFIYTDEFKAYTQGFLKIQKYEGHNPTTVYTLGDREYSIRQYGMYTEEKWYKVTEKGAIKHRTGDLPAVIHSRNNDGSIIGLRWYFDGKLHRIGDLAAEINYYKNGNLFSQYWYRHSRLHRDNGPARIYYNKDEIRSQQWYLNGVEYTEAQFQSKLDAVKRGLVP